ncbi:MAG: ABC transporter substrate-binding protein [Alphaproteobacteria bacterium]|nr:ABC transporter substrate-binding protein [Alphaproteobacteria bacterium]
MFKDNFFKISLSKVCLTALLGVFFTSDAFAYGSNFLPDKTTKERERLALKCGAPASHDPFVIGGFVNYPPFSWKMPSRVKLRSRDDVVTWSYDGFVPEAVRSALHDIGIEKITEVMYDNSEDLRHAAQKGAVDIVFTAFYDVKTQASMDLIYPAYFGNPINLFSLKENPIEYNEPKDLVGKMGAVRKEETTYSLVRGILPTDTKIIEIEGAKATFEKLLSGEVDFVITGRYAGIAEAKAMGIYDKLYVAKNPVRALKFFAAFSKLSRCTEFKPYFDKEFHKYFTNKEELKNRMKKYIDKWAEIGEIPVPYYSEE